MSAVETETPNQVIHHHHFIHNSNDGIYLGPTADGGTPPPAGVASHYGHHYYGRSYRLDVDGPTDGVFRWLGLAALIAATVMLFVYAVNHIKWHDSKPTTPTITHNVPTATSYGHRIVTNQTLVAARGLNPSHMRITGWTMNADGSYNINVAAPGRTVSFTVPHHQVQLKTSKTAHHTTGIANYVFRALYSQPLYVGTQRVRADDPFAPHSGGGRVTRFIKERNTLDLGGLIPIDLKRLLIVMPRK